MKRIEDYCVCQPVHEGIDGGNELSSHEGWSGPHYSKVHIFERFLCVARTFGAFSLWPVIVSFVCRSYDRDRSIFANV
jgi:hypothetical protein